MTTELDLAQQLFEAQQDGRQDVDAAPFSTLDRAAAYRILHASSICSARSLHC